MTTDRWLAVIGLALAALSIPLSILISRHYYRRSNKKRVPTFVIESRKVLCQPELTTTVPDLKVTCEGKPVGAEGITRTKIYFWNSGNETIRADDVLQTYSISLPVPILSYKVCKVSREVVQFSVERSTDKQLSLKFSVLEEGDGCTLEVVYDGGPSVGIEFNGASLDAPKPKVLPPHPVYSLPKSKRFREAYLPVLAIPLISVIAVAILGAVLLLVVGGGGFVLTKVFGQNVANKIGSGLATAGMVVMFLFVIGSMAWPKIRTLNAPYLPPDVKD